MYFSNATNIIVAEMSNGVICSSSITGVSLGKVVVRNTRKGALMLSRTLEI